MDKEQIEKAAERGIEVTAKTGWPRWVQITVSAIIGAIAGIAGLLSLQGCTYSQSQTDADGVTTTKVFALDAATARDLIKLYGVPEIPNVKPTK